MDGFDYAEEQTKTRSFANGDMVPVGTDSAYGVEFYMGKVPNFDNTDYRAVPHLRLRLAGDNNRIYDQPVLMDSTPVRPSDPDRFPREWAAFVRGENLQSSGTLIVDWDRAEPGDVRRLEMQGIKTVEELARVGDHQLHNLGIGSRVLRDAARAHLNAQPDPEKAAMEEKLDKLSAVLSSLLGILTPDQQAQLQAANAQAAAAVEGAGTEAAGAAKDAPASPRRPRAAA